MDPLTLFPAPRRRHLQLPDAVVWLEEAFLSGPDADRLLQRLIAELPLRQEEIVIFGQRRLAPRLTCWLGDPGATYAYSGVHHDPLPPTPSVDALRRRVQDAVGAPFDSVLVNLYRDGDDAMGWHADDEPELGPEPLIASVSLGASRTFRMKHRTRTELSPVSLELESGSLLVMAGPTQRCWVHEVPRRRRVRSPRLNLTFRQVRCRRAADGDGVHCREDPRTGPPR